MRRNNSSGNGRERNVLAIASECAPLVKTGGLADVAGALPSALAPLGWRVRTLMPGYRMLMQMLAQVRAKTVLEEADLFGGPARVLEATIGGLDLLILDAPHLYDRPGTPYLDAHGRDWDDNPERFAALCWMGARIGVEGIPGWRPDILHLHDWQAGLTPIYLRTMGGGPRSVFTIHNIAFQGMIDRDRLEKLRLPIEGYTPSGFEFYGKISAMKAGLVGADRLTTVSPTYARELRTPEFGMGFDGVIRARSADCVGILNGIDEQVWDPAGDPAIVPFSAPGGKSVGGKSVGGKSANRALLLEEFGLRQGEGPVCVVVSRLSRQKGLDLLLEALPALTSRDGRLLLLGSGDPSLERDWLRAAEGSERVAVRIGYDEALSHRMYAGGDAVLVPSRFEPCGLTQLYGLRYGAIPVVSLTGGLADTVINANDAGLIAGVATGIQFHPITATALGDALARLCALHADEKSWSKLQVNAMKHPSGWDVSARRYAEIFESLMIPDVSFNSPLRAGSS
jgi:starch synthase